MGAEKGDIGLCIPNKAKDGRVKAPAIRKNANSEPVPLNRATMKDGTYPIPRLAYFIWDANSPAIVKELVEYCSTVGFDPK